MLRRDAFSPASPPVPRCCLPPARRSNQELAHLCQTSQLHSNWAGLPKLCATTRFNPVLWQPVIPVPPDLAKPIITNAAQPMFLCFQHVGSLTLIGTQPCAERKPVTQWQPANQALYLTSNKPRRCLRRGIQCLTSQNGNSLGRRKQHHGTACCLGVNPCNMTIPPFSLSAVVKFSTCQ